MSETPHPGRPPSPAYLYRYDALAVLRSFHHDDRIRARRIRSVEGPPRDHHQLRDALAAVGDDEGVFALFMWKDLASAMPDLRFGAAVGPVPGGRVDVFQRVRANHPFFARYKCGEDEYLPGRAWIYWATLPIRDDPDWSEDGISFADIEVLLPDGRWVPFREAPCLDHRPLPGWTTITVPAFWPGDHAAICHACEVEVPATEGDTEKWVLMQRSANLGGSAIHPADDCQRRQLVEAAVHAFPDLIHRGRLLLVHEGEGEPYAFEIPLVRWQPAEGRIAALLRVLRGRMPPAAVIARIGDPELATASTICRLYHAAGLPDAMDGDRRWAITDATMQGLAKEI